MGSIRGTLSVVCRLVYVLRLARVGVILYCRQSLDSNTSGYYQQLAYVNIGLNLLNKFHNNDATKNYIFYNFRQDIVVLSSYLYFFV